jgi:hypothetical protein
MNTKSLQSQNIKTVFHPSMFEQQPIKASDEGVQRTLLSVREERDQRLSEKDFKNIVSKGVYKFATEEGNNIGKNNARHMFKNLYGDTPLTFLYFSDRNVDNVQKLLRLRVFKETEYVIDNQSKNELLIVMRGIFLEHSSHPPLIHQDMSKDQVEILLTKNTNEVDRLNKLLVEIVVPKLIVQLKQYFGYLKDASSQPIPLSQPVNESTAGKKAYKSVTQVLFGGEF